jgi:hypothetical protein
LSAITEPAPNLTTHLADDFRCQRCFQRLLPGSMNDASAGKFFAVPKNERVEL